MGTLTMALTAALLVGSVPDAPSGAQKVLGDGRWAGFKEQEAVPSGSVWLEGKSLSIHFQPTGVAVCTRRFRIKDEGGGRFRMCRDGVAWLGIYKWDGGCLVLCSNDYPAGTCGGDDYPTSFQSGEGQWRVALRPISSRK
jgi:hypothetical protein